MNKRLTILIVGLLCAVGVLPRMLWSTSEGGQEATQPVQSTEEPYAVVRDPYIEVNCSQVLLSTRKGYHTADINVTGISLDAGGIQLSLADEVPFVSCPTSISKSEAEAGTTITLTLDTSAEGKQTLLTQLKLTSGTTTVQVPLMVSVDKGFVEQPGNLIYDPCFYTTDRLTMWQTAPTIVTLADGAGVKCGATCMKLAGSKTGLEMKGNLYFTEGSYKITGWIKTNGTFETGVYRSSGTGTFSTTDAGVADQKGGTSVNFLIPDTKGAWQEFTYTFVVSGTLSGGAWINNDRSKTATEVYLDNWQIYPTRYAYQDDEVVDYKDYTITPTPFTEVKLTDAFWAPRMVQNQQVTIPIALEQCETTGRIDNFRKAAAILKGDNIGYFNTIYTFDDTDIYKILEGMSYSIQTQPSAELSAKMDELIAIVGAAQEPDGYLYTARTAGKPGHYHGWVGARRWEADPDLSHELYNSGHLYEAAYAHYNATGKTTLLDIATRNADLLVKDFLEGGLTYEPGHQIVEMGLVKLYRATSKKEYLQLAKYFLDLRGNKGVMRREYSQAHKPVVMQDEAVGHAVRAAYMYSGMADVAAMMGSTSYLNAIDRIWDNVASKKLYITGGIGAQHAGESFGANYDLPNKTAYCETCAAIANVYWNHRQFLLHGESKYYDVLERTLYNGLISGIGLDGKTFFYPNPLEADGSYNFNHDNTKCRQEWFGCACCPSNLCRFLASVPGYVYAVKDQTLYVNLYMQSTSEVSLPGGKVKVEQITDYPWQGDVSMVVTPESGAQLSQVKLRIPGWAQNKPVPTDLYAYTSDSGQRATLRINGKKVRYTVADDGYVTLKRRWRAGDKITLSLPMEVHKVVANELVTADAGKLAIERGPLLYCFEDADNACSLSCTAISPEAAATTRNYSVCGHAVVALSVQGTTVDEEGAKQSVALTAIPYYAWANRSQAPRMAVWMDTEAKTRNAYRFVASEWVIGDANRATDLAVNNDNTLTVTGKRGNNNICLNLNSSCNDKYFVFPTQRYFAVAGNDLEAGNTLSYLWWFNNTNKASSVQPDYTCKNADGSKVFVWNLDNIGFYTVPEEGFTLKANTIFGLTSSAATGKAVITDIAFYSKEALMEKYPQVAADYPTEFVMELDEEKVANPVADLTATVSLKRVLKCCRWNTLCLPFDLTAEQLQACKISEVRALTGSTLADGQVTLNFQKTEQVKAGKPYIVQVSEDIEGFTLDNIKVEAAAPVAVSTTYADMQGTYNRVNAPDGSYVISSDRFYKVDSEVAVKGFRAWMTAKDSGVGVNYMVIDLDPTLSKELRSTREVDVYTLDGLKIRENVGAGKALEGLPHGVYIIDNHKTIVR